ncbi:50S ribosomal protein L25 [Desulfosediminicola flagellatus]|uniref:50S ribosomal protein L25 n=1 Tax=Desulfosediminicola flagellatus TaxID=2569541 RepID=UPI0010AC6334|nr:50S ribosomal protein L25 [Desulfosediminicola flagellatus]
MLQVEISASVRETSGKGAMRRLRSEGITPAVVYGAGADALALQMETKTLTATLLKIVRRNAVVSLKIDENTEKSVVVKEIQTDPITDALVHADFCEIDLEKAKLFNVPIKLTGTSKGVDLGGFLEFAKKEVELKGKPLDIPNEVTLDITALNIGDSLTFSAIAVPAGVEVMDKADKTCVAVNK